jgi:hypothetical protein
VADESHREREAEGYHTYGSLFHRLREFLIESELLKQIGGSPESWESIRPSDFVEVRGIFHRNPLMAWIETVDRMMRLARPVYSGQATNKQGVQPGTRANPKSKKSVSASPIGTDVTKTMDSVK